MPTAGAGAVDRVVDGLLHLLGFDVLRGIDATRARDEVTGSLLAFTAALARRRPVVMVLSDLHWADEAVLEVVGGLLQSMIRLPFAVLATARPALTGAGRRRRAGTTRSWSTSIPSGGTPRRSFSAPSPATA